MNIQQSNILRPSQIPPLSESAGQPIPKSRLSKQTLESICKFAVLFGMQCGVAQLFDSCTIELGEKERMSGYALAEKLLGVMDIPNSTRTVTSRGMMKTA